MPNGDAGAVHAETLAAIAGLEQRKGSPTRIGPRNPVWKRQQEGADENKITRIWERFIGNTDACYWGLTYPETILVRRMCSSMGIGDDLKPTLKVNDDLIPIAYIVLSARGGDTDDYAFDYATQRAPTLLQWTPEDRALLEREMPGGRVTALAAEIEIISTISLPTINKYIDFFVMAGRSISGYESTLFPCIERALKTSSGSSPECLAALEALGTMRTDMTGWSDLIGTLLRG